MDSLPSAVLAWCAVSLALAGLVKGVAGIGIPLVGVSLLSLVLTVPQAVALLPVPIVVANTWQAVAGGIFLQTCRRHALLIVAMGVGTFAGGALLSFVRPGLLMGILGVIVLVFAASELRRVRIRVPVRHRGLAGGVAGLVGGVLGGLSGVFGPPIIMYLASLELRKEEFVGTISSIYLTTGVLLGVMLAGYGIASGDELLWSVVAAAPLLVGLTVGQFARRHVSETLFRNVLMLLLLVIGLNMIRRAFVA